MFLTSANRTAGLPPGRRGGEKEGSGEERERERESRGGEERETAFNISFVQTVGTKPKQNNCTPIWNETIQLTFSPNYKTPNFHDIEDKKDR